MLFPASSEPPPRPVLCARQRFGLAEHSSVALLDLNSQKTQERVCAKPVQPFCMPVERLLVLKQQLLVTSLALLVHRFC